MKPGRERRKAWIYSVINPLLNGLGIEASFLERGNWTFRQQNGELELIRPLDAYVDYQSRPNWEDFIKSNSDVAPPLRDREARREELRKACRAAFDYLVTGEKFGDEVSRCLASFRAAERGALGQQNDDAVAESIASYSREVAEFIVNNIRGTPGYAYREFWPRFGDELMQFRKGPRFEEADRAGAELKKSNDILSEGLIKLRSSLAEEYDIPWAPYYDESMVLPTL
ncbi:MAG TPA: hypothetical protein VKM93_23065 [Terriglobia bacterium]|nr:hypothetical protein [Terriglobia bacterium]